MMRKAVFVLVLLFRLGAAGLVLAQNEAVADECAGLGVPTCNGAFETLEKLKKYVENGNQAGAASLMNYPLEIVSVSELHYYLENKDRFLKSYKLLFNARMSQLLREGAPYVQYFSDGIGIGLRLEKDGASAYLILREKKGVWQVVTLVY